MVSTHKFIHRHVLAYTPTQVDPRVFLEHGVLRKKLLLCIIGIFFIVIDFNLFKMLSLAVQYSVDFVC